MKLLTVPDIFEKIYRGFTYLFYIDLSVTLTAILHLGASVETNSSSFATIPFDHSFAQVLFVQQPTVASIKPTSFSYYVDGLYGNDCGVRIANHSKANNLQVSMADFYCACYGECEPPMAPNPGAVAWVQAKQQALYSTAAVLQNFQKNAILITIIGLVVISGLVGQYKTMNEC